MVIWTRCSLDPQQHISFPDPDMSRSLLVAGEYHSDLHRNTRNRTFHMVCNSHHFYMNVSFCIPLLRYHWIDRTYPCHLENKYDHPEVFYIYVNCRTAQWLCWLLRIHHHRSCHHMHNLEVCDTEHFSRYTYYHMPDCYYIPCSIHSMMKIL